MLNFSSVSILKSKSSGCCAAFWRLVGQQSDSSLSVKR
ncbi:MAG: hypothetical protein OFPI_01120 [Osedax symbiont Rs2]|nr:MAG: hypothetical protein OFPI_01120 [Osedax symbiont Rs2]